MATFRAVEDIEAWQKARGLVRVIYQVSSLGPFARDAVLRNQIRRAAVSVLSNISEGFERNGSSEFSHFLSVAKGSLGEIKAQLYVALDQGYLDKAAFDSLEETVATTSRLIGGLMTYLSRSNVRGAKFKRATMT